MDNNIQLAILNTRKTQGDDQGPIALKTSHLMGAFFLMFFGHGIALLVLFCEIFAARRLKNRMAKLNE